MKFSCIAAVAATLSFATAASAQTTTVAGGSGQRSLPISGFDPLGQSFIATGTNLTSFGFQFQTLNAGSANSPLTLSLLSGSGFGGPVLTSVTATATGIPSTRTPTWFDFNLTGTTLMAGQTYTALLTSSSNRLALIYGPDINLSTGVALGGDAYTSGRLFATGFSNAVCDRGICDANFRFTAVTPTGAVPEPATWAMLIAGFGAIGSMQRRRRTTARVAIV